LLVGDRGLKLTNHLCLVLGYECVDLCLHSLSHKELYDVYTSPNIIRVMKSSKMCSACSTYGDEQRHAQDLGEKI